MHPAPSLLELPSISSLAQHPQHQQQQPQQQQQQQPTAGHHNHASASPVGGLSPIRKDTGSSTSTNATDATAVTATSNDTNSTAYSIESSSSIFQAKDGAEVSSTRRASRRRTGPLSAQQREKAALIRKLGACADCRRRRVACHPNHHNMTWEDAMRKYHSHSPMPELAPLAGRPISPASGKPRQPFTDHQDMDIDEPAPSHSTPAARLPLNDSRIRTPLPSFGSRMDRPLSIPPLALPLPKLDKTELETASSKILAYPRKGRYSSVLALLICWQDDDDPDAVAAVEELGEVFDKYYHFASQIRRIPPSSSDGCKSSSRWLSRTINEFTDRSDTRDVLKIVYYNGGSYLDENGEMVLASSSDRERVSTIRWNAIQQTLEEACSDTLIMMDATYYPSSRMVRQKGVLELVAASASQQHFDLVGKNNFTRALADQLRIRATGRIPNAFSAAELHLHLLSVYPRIIRDQYPERERTTNDPTPLHLQVSGSSRLPSITLSPLQPTQPRTPLFSSEAPASQQVTLSLRLTGEALNIESWTEWLRIMPEGIKDASLQGPYPMF